jgi:hypothetical protein
MSATSFFASAKSCCARLIARAEGLEERRCLGILHRLALCPGGLGSGVLCGRALHPSILHPPDDLFSGILHAHLCPRIMDGLDASALLHDSEIYSGILRSLRRGILRLCPGILHNPRRGIRHSLCRGILNGLYGPDICLRFFLGSPGLELPEQGFR